MKRKILSLILVFAMTVSLLTVGTGAVEPTYGDTAGHWAESSIERWSAYGIIQGSNGQFDPNGQLTCAQLATILAKLLKLPAAKDAGFTDNTADAWYYDAINRCAAAGILNGNGDGTVTPEAPITRERAMVMLARALGIEPIRKPDLTKYTDAAQVSAYARGYVAALIEAGIVGGVTADELAPQDNINRASTVTILDRAISTYADQAGETVKVDGKGLVLVVAENVKITGAPEGTKIVVADGATGLTVNGKSVSDDQTYIVPKTEPAKPSSGSSGGYSHSHSYDTSKWVFDDETHWHASTCGHNLKIDEATHTFTYADNGNGTHTKSCSACSYSATEAHSYDKSNRCVCGLVKPTENILASVKQADGTCTYYSTLPEAVAAAANGATIALLNKQELSANLVFSTKVTLNLNGRAVETKGYAIQVQGSGDLTVAGNGTVNNDQEAEEVNNKKNYRTIFSVEGETGKLTIENGTFTTKASQAIFAEGTVTIHDGTFQNTAESVNEVLDSSAMITANGSAAAVTIYKASVIATAESTNAGIYGIYGANGAHITLEDGVEVHTSFAAIGMNNTTSNPEVVITVNGGTYKSECQQLDNSKHSKFNTVCYLPGKCHMTINGGTFTAGNEKMHVFSIPYAQAGMNLTITDGTFTAGSNVFYSKNDDHKNQTTANMITVSGGSFTGAVADFNENNTFSSFITGGTFSSDPTAYVAEGYIARENNGKYVVSMVGTAENPYTLNEFNTLTKLPAGRAKLYVNLGGASLQDGLTIGNEKIADRYRYGEPNSTTAPEGFPHDTGRTDNDNRHIYSTGKDTVTVVVTGSVTGATDTGDFNAGDITLKVPDAANVIFDTVTFGEGQMAMSMWTESHVQSMTVSHRLASVTFNGCTFKGNWLQNGAFGADEMTITGCTFEKYENTAGINSAGFDCKNNSNPIWIQNMGQTNVTIEGCTINAVRPIKLWEGGANGSVTIRGNTFNIEKCSIDDDNTHKNIAIMFCGTTAQVKLGNVEISGNTVTGDATSLICFYNGRNAGENHYPAMNEGATFSLYNNILPEGTALSVIWKSAEEWTPDYISLPR